MSRLGAVGESLLFEIRDELGHLRNVISGAGENRLLDVESGAVLKKSLLIFGGVVFDAQALLGRVADNLVVHVGDVHYMPDGESLLQQEAPENVHCNKSTKIADVTVVVDSRAAGIHPNFIALQRLKFFDLA